MTKNKNDQYLRELRKAVRAAEKLDFDIALEKCQIAAEISPEAIGHYYVLGLIAYSMQDTGRAIQFMSEGHEKSPDALEFVDALCFLYGQSGNIQESLYFAKLNLVSTSDKLLAEFALPYFSSLDKVIQNVAEPGLLIAAEVHLHNGNLEDCIRSCERSLAISADDDKCLYVLGRALLGLGRSTEAIDAFKRSIQVNPKNLNPILGLGDGFKQIGDNASAKDVIFKGIELYPNSIELLNQYLCLSPFLNNGEEQETEGVVKQLSKLLSDKSKRIGTRVKRLERLNVSLLVNEHAIVKNGAFLEALVKNYNPVRMRLTIYQQYSLKTRQTDVLRANVQDWRETYDVDDETLKLIIANDGTDAVIDMCGCALGHRQELLSSLTGPLRISWLSFPHNVTIPETTDVVLLDTSIISKKLAASQSIKHYPMKGTLLSYVGGSTLLESATAVQEANTNEENAGTFKFGVELEMAEIENSYPLWLETLEACPGTTLLFYYHGAVITDAEQRVKALFGTADMDNRIEFHTAENDQVKRSTFFADIDVMLDAINVSEPGSICDALWMGVPVISLGRTSVHSNMGPYILSLAGYGEYVASTKEEFTSIAKGMVDNPAKLAKFKASSRKNMEASKLCDSKEFARNFEEMLFELIEPA